MSPGDDASPAVRRRTFIALLALALVGAGLVLRRWFRRPDEVASGRAAYTEEGAEPEIAEASAERERSSGERSGAVFDVASLPVLFALADAIVPREADAPAASEIDLLPQLETWIASTPRRRLAYRALWPELERAFRSRFPDTSAIDPSELDAQCGEWFAKQRERGVRAGSAARMFEQLRRDVLRVYYASPQGWAVVGFSGPARRHSAERDAT